MTSRMFAIELDTETIPPQQCVVVVHWILRPVHVEHRGCRIAYSVQVTLSFPVPLVIFSTLTVSSPMRYFHSIPMGLCGPIDSGRSSRLQTLPMDSGWADPVGCRCGTIPSSSESCHEVWLQHVDFSMVDFLPSISLCKD